MSLRAQQVPPAPGCEIGFALRGGGIPAPLRDEWHKSLTTFLAASEHGAIHGVADWVRELRRAGRVVARVIFFEKVSIHALALTAYHGYRVRTIGLGIWIDK